MLSPRAAAVREAYLKHRRMIHEGYRDSERWQKCWESAAVLIDEKGYDLDGFIEAQFYFMKPFPMPNHLYSESAEKRYKSFVTDDSIGNEITTQIESELNYLTTRLNLFFKMEWIICSPAAPLSALFRFLSAKMFERDDLAVHFEEDARQQAAQHPNLAKAYKQVLNVGGISWL